MAIFNKYPYTSFQELNLDWILQELKDLVDEWAVFENQYQGITATAQTVPYGSGANVTVTGGSGTPFNFDFNIPAGKDLKLASSIIKYGTSADINTPPGTWYDSIPAVAQGDYLWTRVTLNFTDGTQSTFYTASRNGLDGLGSVVTVNNISPDGNGNVSIPIPQPSDNTPLMDTSLGSEGVSSDYSRADHQHISDTSKLDVKSGNSIGDLNAYVVQDISTQTIIPVSSSASANSIARYTANGTMVVAEPQTDYEAPRLLDVKNGFVSTTDITNYVAKTDIATASDLGIVQPDGVTITIDSDGIISALASSSLTVDTLWTNASPSSNFANQSVAIDMTDYKLILVSYSYSTSSTNHMVAVLNDNVDYYMLWPAYRNYRRVVTKTSSNLAFDDCVYWGTYASSSTTTSNGNIIPINIYGIK